MITRSYLPGIGPVVQVSLDLTIRREDFYALIEKVSYLHQGPKSRRSVGRFQLQGDANRYVTYSARNQLPLELSLLASADKSGIAGQSSLVKAED